MIRTVQSASNVKGNEETQYFNVVFVLILQAEKRKYLLKNNPL
jgi:hypothetical protein